VTELFDDASATPSHPIVGIGASASAIEAIEGLFRGLSAHPGAALVLVTHVKSAREIALHALIERFTPLPVETAQNDTVLQPNRVYVVPAGTVATMHMGAIRLRPEVDPTKTRNRIDTFFGSLAEDVGERAAGILLAGADSDGTLGIKAIKERGGLTLAQTVALHESARDDLPESAVTVGVVDIALPVEGMGQRLTEFTRGLELLENIDLESRHDTEVRRLSEARKSIYSILLKQCGHDFSGYKFKTFLRRVQRRMQIVQVESIEDYVGKLSHDAPEVNALFRDLLINVTSFFRDEEAFQNLAQLVIPKLFEGRNNEDTVRVWVPGCSTGEEVFSLGILMLEYMESLEIVPRVQIFATDIDDSALSVARTGRYPEALLQAVSPARRKRFFIRDGESFLVAKAVRDMCIFSPHSVIRDPPFSRIDMVSCRNLLIYFGADIQRRVIPTFHYALRPDGFLFLGMSENVTQFTDLFAPVEKNHRIFQRRSDSNKARRLPLSVSSLQIAEQADLPARRPPAGSVVFRQMVDAHVLERFAPPHVVVNRDGDVVYYSGRTGKYLQAAPGAPTRQVLSMARKGLALDLRTLFREAVESGRVATRDSVGVEDDDSRVQLINLTVEPLHQRENEERMFLILFTDQGPILSQEEALARAHLAHDGAAMQTERELRDTRERLQSMIEEYETALEELKSSNEELVSVNEELQSTNEELQASKEELVSLNEELRTLNNELTTKVSQLDRANSDLQNLFDSTAVATVFLDRHLIIRSFTPAMGEVFSILPGDCGRPITDLACRLLLPDFQDDVAAVLQEHRVVERRISSMDGQHYLVRLAPYRDGHQRTDGVVVAFVNVTTLQRAEERQQVLIAELQHRTRNLLGVVQAIAGRTLGKDPSLQKYLQRLSALGRLQSLLGKANGDLIDFEEIIRLELQAIGAGKESRITISGPRIFINFESMQTVALAIHELATNAVKYGALMQDGAKLSVQWQIDPDSAASRTLVLDWWETGLVVAPDVSRKGYGRELIEHAVSYSLRAKTALAFNDDSVHCRIEIPMSNTSFSDPPIN